MTAPPPSSHATAAQFTVPAPAVLSSPHIQTLGERTPIAGNTLGHHLGPKSGADAGGARANAQACASLPGWRKKMVGLQETPPPFSIFLHCVLCLVNLMGNPWIYHGFAL